MRELLRQAWACGFLFLFLILRGPVAAQSPAPVEEAASADEQTVAAEEQEPQATYTEEITVKESPSLTMPSPETVRQELARIPGGASYVDAEDFKRGRASTLKDALDFTPGVFAQPRFGGEEARLSIRGSGLQRTFHGRGLKLLQDGVPLNLADGSFDFQAVEPLVSRFVEVYRGGNGLEYGASTLGGAINYVSLNGHQARPAQVRAESGAFGYQRAQVSSGGVHGPFDSYGSLTHFSQEGFRRHAEQSSQRFFGNFGYRLSADRETRFFLTALRTDSELPGSLTKAQLASDARQAAPGNVALDQKRDFDLFRLANRTSFRLDESSHVDVGTFWSYKHLDHPIFQVLDQLSHDFGADLRYEKSASLAGHTHRWIAGLSPVVGFLEDNRFRNVDGRRGDRTAKGDTRSTNVDLYFEDRVQLRPAWTLVAGLQASWADRDFSDDFLADGDQTDTQDFQGLSPRIGLFWDLSPRVALFGNVGRSFEPPTYGELANVGGSGLLQLDAQTALSVEIGSRGTAGAAAWDVVFYHARLRNEFLSLNDAVGNPLGTHNADRTLHSGVEAGLSLRFATAGSGNAFVLRQVYNWSRFRFDGDPVYGDHQLAGLPEHFYRAELLWEPASGFYGGPNVEWVPAETPVDHANTLFADPYTIVGLKVGYRSQSGWAGFVEGKNLSDRAYAATTGVIADARGRDSAQFLPGDGASVFAGIEYRW